MTIRVRTPFGVPQRNNSNLQQGLNKATGYEELLRTVQEIKNIRATFERDTTALMADYERKLNDAIKRVQKGDKGDDAPQLDVIVSSVLAKIRQPQDGHTPTTDELKALIAPLIPKVKDGKSADEVKIVGQVLARIQQPKAPVLAEIVKTVIEKLKGAFSIDDIKGLRQELRSISSAAMLGGKGGGGGMGSIKPFTLTGDGSTTEFTLPEKPTQEGLGVLAYYQGQWLQPNTHYTVSGKTISLTFTPDNATNIEGIVIT